VNVFGKIHEVGQVVNHTEAFKTAKFVLETQDQYPQKLQFQLLNDKTDLASGIRSGQFAKIHFHIKGKEWKGNYYTNLNAWKIELGEQKSNQHENGVQETIEESQEEKIDSISLEEDLAF
jgi:single-strand DNA-binding protein|tara:strand:- start:3832 stop:4191 length:360 start_codon:yes stop_codon:yes gene_type:complete